MKEKSTEKKTFIWSTISRTKRQVWNTGCRHENTCNAACPYIHEFKFPQIRVLGNIQHYNKMG